MMLFKRFKLIKSDEKDIYNVKKDFYSDKCCSSEHSIDQSDLKKIYCAVFNIKIIIIIIINIFSRKSEY